MPRLSSGSSRFLPGLLVMLAVLALGGALLVQWLTPAGSQADPQDDAQVATGKQLYGQYCVACHLGQLQGQPNWEQRLPSGRMPAPPHDDSGHTWHHPDQVLFGIIRDGLVPPYAPAGYESDMPAFGAQLNDDQIWALLAFIKSHWSPGVQAWQEDKTRQY